MKRVLIGLVAVGFVVAAISIARANSGDIPEAKASPTTSTPAEPSKPFDRDLTTQQIEQQAEQLRQAQAELAKDVAEEANSGAHTLIVTMREERPGDVWIIGKIDGKPACVTPPKEIPTSVNVSEGRGRSYVVTEMAPFEATLLKSGACEAKLEISVLHLDQYVITVAGAHSTFNPVTVRNSGRPQQVTIVG